MVCVRCGKELENEHGPCLFCGTYQYPLCLEAPRKQRSRLLTVLTAAVLAIICILMILLIMPHNKPTSVNTGPDDSTVSSACFHIEDGALTFDRRKYHGERILIVPAYVGNNAVTCISARCFREVTGITTVLLPNSITDIGDGAFEGCSALRGVLLPEGIRTVGENAFNGCSSLESIFVPLSLNTVGIDAFENCPKLSYIFYNGFYDTWLEMYGKMITPFTWVSCLDGDYRHASNQMP